MLSFKLVAKFAFFASLASSSPLAHTKRVDPATGEVAAATNDVTADIGILNFALTLEHLEHQFYLESLHRFGEQDFRRANIPNPTQALQNFHHILQHEAQHVKTLQAVITSLGGTPLPPCEYNFGVEDVHGFMALARKLEKVGVSAYDGAVALLNNSELQTAAATIDTVEARHSSFIATSTGVDPFPEDFDVPLGADQIITLASAVIHKCPFDIKSTLGAAPAGTLSLVAPHAVRAGRTITVKFDPGQSKSEDHFCSFLFSDKSVVVPLSSDFKCKVPRGCRGDIFVAILNKNEKLTLKNSVGIIAAGPIIVNVDTSIDDSCKKFVHGVDFEWNAYDIKYNKVYDVDGHEKNDNSDAHEYKSNDQSENKSNGHSEVDATEEHAEDDASEEHAEVDASEEHAEVDASEDHAEVDASEEHAEVDALEDHAEVESSEDHAKVDGSEDLAEVDASEDHAEVGASEDHAEVDASEDHAEVDASEDHAEVDASEDHAEVESSEDHAEVDASEEHAEVDASEEHVEVDASEDHAEVDASTEVTSELKYSEYGKNDFTPSYRKRGLTSSYSSRAELPLWSGPPNPEDSPAASESGEIKEDDGAGAESADVHPDGWDGGYNDMAVDIDDAEDENNDMVHENTENSDLDYDEMKHTEHETTESIDMDYGNTEKGDGMNSIDMNHGESGVMDDDNSGAAEPSVEDNVYGLPDETTIESTPALVVHPVDSHVPDPSSPIPADEPVSTDDAINALRAEVARAEADEEWNEKEELVNNVSEPAEEPVVEIDGAELEAPYSALEADVPESETGIEGTAEADLPDTKVDISDANDVVADLEAQLQKIESQRKA